MADDDRTDDRTTTNGPPHAASAGGDGRRYDLQDLRLRISLGCSAGEVSELAARFGVPAELGPGSGAASADASARTLLRELDRQGRLGALVDYLSEAKPLVEWPSPLAPTPEVPDEAPYPPPAGGALPLVPAPPLLLPGDGPLGAATADGAPSAAPNEPPAATLPEPTQEQPSGGAPPRPARPILLDPLADLDDASAPGSAVGSWLGLPRARIVLLASAALVVVAIAVAVGFWVGRGGPSGPSASSSDGSTPAAAGPTSLAASASEELTLAVAAVARACGVSNAAGPARDVLAQAFRRCDRSSLPSLPPRAPQAGAADGPTAEPPSRPPAGGQAAPRPAPTPARGGCLQRCQQEHGQCKQNECGEEPTQGSQYEEYQRCLGRCLTRASQCKMRCG